MRGLSNYLRSKKQNCKTKKLFPKFLKKQEKIVSKTAILIGLNYPESVYELSGCINDVKNGAMYLRNFGYKIKLLFDDKVSETYNVLEALNELKNCKDKNVFFHYSGHGTQTVDLNNDEKDGMDEVIYSSGNVMVTDDDINKILKEFPEDKVVFLVFDCCHSGSIVDFPYSLTMNNVNENKVNRDVKAKIICISGCQDNQTSADVTTNGTSYGALSSSLYALLREYKKKKMKVTWRKLYVDLLYKMTNKGYLQVPNISASDPKLLDQIIAF